MHVYLDLRLNVCVHKQGSKFHLLIVSRDKVNINQKTSAFFFFGETVKSIVYRLRGGSEPWPERKTTEIINMMEGELEGKKQTC